MKSIDEVVGQISFVYSTCTSYQDNGLAQYVIEDGRQNSCVSRSKFQTLVLPPRLFRFEFRDELFPDDKQNILCIGPDSIESNVFEVDAKTSLRSAVAKMHGISKGAAGLIPTLILPDLKDLLKERILDLPFRDIETRQVKGCDCYILSTADGDKLMCGKEDYLIRYAETRLSSNPPKLVKYDFESIKINIPIELRMFRLSFLA